MKYVSLAANFHSGAHFPSSYQFDYVASFVSPVSSEIELWLFERDAVENAVQSLLMDNANDGNPLRAHLGLRGSVTSESHSNLGNNNNNNAFSAGASMATPIAMSSQSPRFEQIYHQRQRGEEWVLAQEHDPTKLVVTETDGRARTPGTLRRTGTSTDNGPAKYTAPPRVGRRSQIGQMLDPAGRAVFQQVTIIEQNISSSYKGQTIIISKLNAKSVLTNDDTSIMHEYLGEFEQFCERVIKNMEEAYSLFAGLPHDEG
ncbi:hypothetical protein DL766_009510 [Monosporascus sp. MC13-8B]|uniref:Uncharacterized protein n=1 Tax=Monosporascus cannonballus TaxID=155416 RepID=A0ABY0GV67_9PEZI|nr:hypothetical protein DL762_008772 [Monosporascus cannonballus]RYO84147.1 hypothetical protein DL763_007576 [Monosporascus cannonballus]RYP15037.1 hypothetical protein DL766_009510 [Monosporascus sp. MC13-8B]